MSERDPAARGTADAGRRWPALTAVLLLSLGLLVLLVDLAAFYLLDQRRVGYDSARFFRFSTLLGWEHRPRAEGTWYAYKDGTTTRVSVNPYGYPDADWDLAEPGSRIALLGDSTMEFWEVPEDRRGHRLLRERLGDGVQVMNFALRGAGTDQLLLRLAQQVDDFRPDVVVYMFCLNDVSNNAAREGKPYFVLDDAEAGGVRLEGYPLRYEAPAETPWPRSMLEQSWVLRTLKYRLVGAGTHFRVDAPLHEHFELRPYKARYDEEEARRMALLRRLIAGFAASTRERGGRFLLVEGIYRPVLDPEMRRVIIDAYGDQFDFRKVSGLLGSWSEEDGYEFLSLQRLVEEQGRDVRQLMHPEDTTHLNARGAEFFAEAVGDRLHDLGWTGGPRAAEPRE